MAFQFPFSNLHELNLDWILSKVKTLVDNNEEFNDKADYAVQTADEAKTIAEQAAQASVADGSITTIKLADGAVTTPKLADNAVTGNKIAQATIQTGNLSAGCVTTTYILDNAVTNEKINDGAVSSAKLSSGAVTNAKIADSAISPVKLAPELRRILLHGYFPSVGRADGDVAISIPYDGNATAAVLSVTTVNVDVYGTGGSGAFTLTLNQISVADGSIYLKFTPSTSVSQVAPNASVCLIAVKGIQYVQLS